MSRFLDRPMPRGRGELVYRQPPVNLGSPSVGGKPHIVFVAYYSYVNVAKKSLLLRRDGGFHTTLVCLCARQDQKPERFFDEVYEAADYADLLALLSKAEPCCLHVHVPHHELAALCIEAAKRTKIPVVADIYDAWLYMERDAAAANRVFEAEVLGHAQGWVHKMPKAGVDGLREVTGFEGPDALIDALPCREFFSTPQAGPGEPWRLVYAGGVMPRQAALRNGHQNQILDPLIEQTGQAGLGLRILVNQNARDMFFEEHAEYLAMRAAWPHFRFEMGVPFFDLPKTLASEHYGLLYDNVELSNYRIELFWYNMSTKIFSYIEAGLPVLVYEEFHHIVDMLAPHGVAVVYDRKKLLDLPQLLAGQDYQGLLAKVRAFRESHELGTMLVPLRALYEDAGAVLPQASS